MQLQGRITVKNDFYHKNKKIKDRTYPTLKEQQTKIPEELLPGYEWETVGGTGKRLKKKGPPIKKRIYQEPIPTTARAPGVEGGKATHGYGKAYLKGGRVK